MNKDEKKYKKYKKNELPSHVYFRCEVCGKWGGYIRTGISKKYYYILIRNGRKYKVWQGAAYCSEKCYDKKYQENNWYGIYENEKIYNIKNKKAVKI